MRPIFEARLKQLTGLGLPGPVIVRRIVDDIASMTDERVHFMADELVALQTLAGPGWEGESLKALVTFVIQSTPAGTTWIPPFDTLRSSLRSQAERDQEAAQKAERARRAQAGADAARMAQEAMERARRANQSAGGFGRGADQFEWANTGGAKGVPPNWQQAFKRMVDKVSPAVDAAMKRLDLKPGFTASDLKSAYRSKAKEAHPDGGGSDAAFAQLTKDRDLLEAHALP